MVDPKSKEAQRNSLVSLDLVQTHVVVLTAAYLYLIGWTFSYYYYDRLGISVHALGIPLYSIFVFTFSVLLWDYNSIPIGAMIIASATVLTVAKRWKPMLRSSIVVTVVVASFVVLFLIANDAGIKTADDKLATDALRSIRLAFNTEAKINLTPEFVELNRGGKLRFVFETPDIYYLVAGSSKNTLTTFEVQRRDVSMVSIK